MKIKIIPHGAKHRNAVVAFNDRMHAGGSVWGFYPAHECDWIPHGVGNPVWREYHLAVDEDEEVRGAFALKPQPWLIHGVQHTVTDWQGPFSEGDIDNQYAAMGLRLIRGMLKLQPLLYSWGHGGSDTSIVQMLTKMGWAIHPTPAAIYVNRPFRFLRGNRYLRRSRLSCLAQDILAFSGLGWIGAKVAHACVRAMHGPSARGKGIVSTVESEFGSWANDVWDACRVDYAAIAVRDAATMNTLLPTDGRWPEAIRLRVKRNGEDIGWAALRDTKLDGDPRFGNLRLGSVIDCLARPADAPEVVAAATRELRRRGVDVILSNQAHPEWARAFSASGYAVLPDKRLFAMSPKLKEALSPWDQTSLGLHLTNLDGHGPHQM